MNGLQSSLYLYKNVHNFVKTHHSLKKEFKENYQKFLIFVIMKIQRIFSNRRFSVINDNVWKKYDKTTPIMSIGLTNHIWSLKELITYPYHKNISI
jgi:hypothetical protein